jgi:hypothetical protein
MPPSDPAASLCAHIVPGEAPFAIELVLDDAGGPTDALVRCRHCGAHWLLEMLDWRGRERLMRVSPLCASRVTALLANLERGSCDSGRAAAEVASATASVIALPCLLALDGRDFSITRLLALPPEQQMPRAGWRALPCDGRWFDRAG